MKNLSRYVPELFKRRAFIIAVIVLILGFFLFRRNGAPAAATVTVKRGTVIESVVATGKTKPKASVDLAFERAGQIAHIYARVGDHVSAGQTIVDLERSELSADVNDAGANVEIQVSKLAELKTGASPETVTLKKAEVTKNETGLSIAQKNLTEKIQDAYTKADNAVRNDVDQFISNPKGNSPTLSFGTSSNQLKSDIEAGRVNIEKILTAWNQSLATLTSGGDIQLTAQTAQNNLTTIAKFLDIVSVAVNALTPNTAISQTTIDGYKAAVSSARADINTATQNISSALEKLSDAEANLTIAQQDLTIALAGGTAEQVKTQEGYVKQAEAKLQGVQAQIGKTMLRSPISGVVVKQDGKVGEIVTQYKTIASVIGETGLEIEAEVPEVNIGKLLTGNPVRITIDAFPGESFAGTMGFIDPAETIIDGVVNFKVKIFFAIEDPRFKSGLTVNLSIETMRKADVLTLPQVAIFETEKGAFVKKLIQGKPVDTPVALGTRGEDSTVEIISGLDEGDEVVTVGTKK